MRQQLHDPLGRRQGESDYGYPAGAVMALTVVQRTCGEAVARATARHMEYPYPETNERRIQVIQEAKIPVG